MLAPPSRRPPAHVIVANRLLRRARNRTRVTYHADWTLHRSAHIQIGTRAFWIDYTGTIHRDWWGDRRLRLLGIGGGR